MKLAVNFYGSDDGHHCGYCKSSSGSRTVGMMTPRLTPQLYQDLIDRGWRRCGTYSYRPIMKETCCPMYTIRCDAEQFILSRSHRRVLRRVRDYLLSGVQPKSTLSKHRESQKQNKSTISHVPRTQESGDVSWSGEDARSPPSNDRKPKAQGDFHQCKSSQREPKTTKAKYIRWQRKLEHFRKLAEKRSCSLEDIMKDYETRRSARLAKNRSKTLEELLDCDSSSMKHRISIKLVRSHPPSKEFQDSLTASHQLYKIYQQVVHGDPPSKVTLDQWQNFLVDSPLLATNFKVGLSKYESVGFGSFHMQYWLDENRLIAVGVVDILPSCLSSVYLYYHPDYAFLNLGTYSALRELALVRELMVVEPQLHHYYMGYYIHSCRKMQYKGQYHPSYLACPETYRWVPISHCRSILDRNKYSRLCDDSSALDDDAVTSETELETLVTLDIRRLVQSRTSSPISYADLKKTFKVGNLDTIKEFGETVGRKCAQKLMFSLS